MDSENMMYFFGWSKVYQYNGTAKKPIYTKQQLSRMGMKPIDINKYEVHKVVVFGSGSGRYRPFRFYTMDNVQRKRTNTKKATN